MAETTRAKRVPSFWCETRTWSLIDEKEARARVDRILAPGSPAPTLERSEPWKLSDPDDELKSFVEILRETEHLAERYAEEHGREALRKLVEDAWPTR